MERKYPLLLLGAPNKRGIVYPKKVVEEAVEHYKKRLKKSGEKISGELFYREKDLISAVVAVPNEKGEILIWDDLVIEGDFLYGILSKESQELLDTNYPEENRSFAIRMATKAVRDNNYNGTGESVAIAVGLVIFTVDKVDKRPDKSVN